MEEVKYQTPKGENVWQWYYDNSGQLRFIMTTKSTSRDYYFLYKYENKKFERLGRAKTPVSLEEKFGVNDIVKGGAK